MVACSREIRWYYYIAGSLITFFGGLLILIPARLCWFALYRGKKTTNYESWRIQKHNFGCCSRMRARAASIVSGHTEASKAGIIFVWLVNMAAIMLYLVEASTFSITECGPVFGDVTQYVWWAFSVVFILHYIVRLTAASDKCYMWVDLYSIVDHFTIVPLVVGIYFNSNWLGLRFLRLFYLLDLPDILQLMHLLKNKNSIRLVQITTIFLSIWLASCGFVHIVENNGDPHKNYSNGQELAYWECVYWLLVTMSTVGFGEISPATDIGRAFIVVFIMGSFAMFTTIIPELASTLGRAHRYQKPYKRTYGKKHIVVCGHITITTVSSFIKNFLHKDANSGDVDVVFVDRNKPSLEMEAFFKRHFNDVKFVQGTVMNMRTLEGIKLRYADACLIIADRSSSDPDGEDAANVMRATAVKNFSPKIRVIVQLLQYRNKLNLLHIPNWGWDKGDEVICVSELKNGILAQNCLAPGVSTLLSNLFTMRTPKSTRSTRWSDLYQTGAGNEIYAEPFSDSFTGLAFTQAVAICYSQLGVLLIAVHVKERDHGRRHLRVNPTDFVISAETIGFFIAQSPEHAQRVTYYKGCIDGSAIDIKVTPKTNGVPSSSAEKAEMAGTVLSPSTLLVKEPIMTSRMSVSSVEDSYLEYLETVGGRLANYSSGGGAFKPPEGHVTGHERQRGQMDATGAVYWAETRSIEECTLTFERLSSHQFSDHVVVCLNADEGSPECGLVSLLSPLRASCLRHHDLMDVVIVAQLEAVRREWSELCNFPGVYVLPQSRNRRQDLRAIGIQRCAMCVVMTAGGHITVDETLLDKEAVLTTLAIKAMFSTKLETRIKAVGVLTNPEVFRRDSLAAGTEIPMITELEHDCNVAYLDPDDDDDPAIPLYRTTPYACGNVFVSSVFDSLVSCTYLNGDVLTLIRALVTGGETAEFEKILAEGFGIVRRDTVDDITAARKMSRLAQLSLSSGPLEKLKHDSTYGSLFIKALETYKVVCLGLYRLMTPDSPDPRERKRVVLCNPSFDTKISLADRVYVLQPFGVLYPDSSSSEASPTTPVKQYNNTNVSFSLGGDVTNRATKL